MDPQEMNIEVAILQLQIQCISLLLKFLKMSLTASRKFWKMYQLAPQTQMTQKERNFNFHSSLYLSQLGNNLLLCFEFSIF